jgi:diguanylate cyclase (GGDEF)-like protein
MKTSHHNLSVLTIDDDEDMRRSIVSYLEDMNFNVYQASGGRQGIDMFDAHHPDLVFTDLMMPEVDGLEVVKEIKRKSPGTPVIVISGNGSVEYAIKAVRSGAWDYITKPIHDFLAINRIVDQVLDRAHALKSERTYQESLQRAVLSQDRQLTEISTVDSLTRLPLRNQIREKFSQFIINENFTGDLFVILVEMDNFKNINETFGHESGDKLAVDLAERLKSLIQPNVAVGRIGTDEFVVMAANCPELMNYVSAIKNLFVEPFIIMGQEVHSGFNMGISSYPQDGESIDALLQHADIARANAKMTGRNHHYFYSRELWDQMQDRIALESGLKKGLERNEFQIHYQPKMDARSLRMVGMEALIRWKPAGSDRLVSPVVFIPVLEESGLINEVGAWVLEKSCRQYVEWLELGMGPVRLSVNISAIQFQSGNLPEVVKNILERTGMEPDKLCLELTESIVVKNIDETIITLKELSSLGIKLSIDDFGTGYSSLSYLKDMPIDELKIDRSFVMNLPGDAASVAIVESVLAMSKSMKMTVVAEGVETTDQADFLAARGCHELQGYLFSKPLAREDFLGWCHGKEFSGEHREQQLDCNWERNQIEQLAGGIAHDFKNLLTGIVGNLSLAKHHFNDKEKSAKAIDRAEKASERANELAHKLMNLSKPESTTKKCISVKTAIEECLALALAGTAVESVIEVAEDIGTVTMDEGELCQVMSNLALNAIQAMPDGGRISVTADNISLESGSKPAVDAGRYLRINLTDTGCGITPDAINNVFDPYFTTKRAGNGLGLASVKRIMDKNRGNIAIESRIGDGTSVTLLLRAS